MNTGKTLFIIIYDQYNLLLLIRINRLCLFPVIIILCYYNDNNDNDNDIALQYNSKYIAIIKDQ